VEFSSKPEEAISTLFLPCSEFLSKTLIWKNTKKQIGSLYFYA
jgi:hypothetical protein